MRYLARIWFTLQKKAWACSPGLFIWRLVIAASSLARVSAAERAEIRAWPEAAAVAPVWPRVRAWTPAELEAGIRAWPEAAAVQLGGLLAQADSPECWGGFLDEE
jgi:hypothetical protein